MIQPEWKIAFILSCEPVQCQMISFSSEKQIVTFLCRNMRPETIITSLSVSSVCSVVRSAETDWNLPHLHTELTGSCYRKWPFMGIKTSMLFSVTSRSPAVWPSALCLLVWASGEPGSSGGQRSSPLSTSAPSVGSTTMEGSLLVNFGYLSWVSGKICVRLM